MTEQCAKSSLPAPEVSIIVPVYKTERTLPACLDSALSQTVSDIEVICVNDGSPDGCAQVLRDYAARDARIRVIAQENAGLSAARNAGMDAACGRIIVFLDSDDTIEPHLCSRVLDAFASEPDVDVVTYGAVCEPPERASTRIRQLLSPGEAVYRRFDPDLLFCANAQPYAWRTALARDFVERAHIRFEPSLRFAEDVAFHFLVYPQARTTVLISDKLYRYRMVEGSLTHRYNAKTSQAQKLDQHLCVLEAIFSAWERCGLHAPCPARMVTWCLDFTLFDLAALESAQAAPRAQRLARMLARAYGPDWDRLPAHSAVRVAGHAVARAETSFHLSRSGLMRFFIATRGFKQCVQRALRRS